MPEQVNPVTPQQPTTTVATKKPINWKLIGIIAVIAAIIIGGLGYTAIVLNVFGGKKEASVETPKVATSSPTTTGKEQPKDETANLDSQTSKVSFVAESGKGPALYIADWDGSNKEILQQFDPKSQEAAGLSWDWSPDNKKIVASSRVIIDIASKKQTAIPVGRCHNWSPDGKKIIYESGGIYIMNSDGTGSRKVADGGMCGGSNSVFHWLPNSSEFFFMVMNKGIYSYNLSTDKLTLVFDALSHGIYQVRELTVSREGNRMAFLGASDKNLTTEDIYIAKTDGSGLEKITNFDKYGVAAQPVFAPGGNVIAFLVNNIYSPYSGLNTVNISTKEIKNLSKNGTDYSPPSISRDGRFISYTSFVGTTGVLLTVDTTTYKVTKLADGQAVLWSK